MVWGWSSSSQEWGGHADRLSGFVPRPYVPLEEAVMAILEWGWKWGKEIVLFGTVREFHVTVGEIENKAKVDGCITEEEGRKIINQQCRKIDGEEIFFCLWWSFDVRQTGGSAGSVEGKSIGGLPCWSFQCGGDGGFNERLCFLDEYTQRDGGKYGVLQGLCNGVRGTTSGIYPLAKTAYRFCRSNEETILFDSG